MYVWYGRLITNFHEIEINERREKYAKVKHEKGAPLDRFVGCTDCKKIEMCRPSRPNENQRAV